MITAKTLHFLAVTFHTFGIEGKHHSQNMAFQLELETVFHDVMSKLHQEPLTEVLCSIL